MGTWDNGNFVVDAAQDRLNEDRERFAKRLEIIKTTFDRLYPVEKSLCEEYI